MPDVGLASSPAEIRFDVTRDGQPIGTHAIRFAATDGRLEARIAVSFDVKLLGFTVYRYRHKSHEIWEDGRLQSLHAHTDDDGARMSVQAERRGDQIVVHGPQGRTDLPGDIMPTSYWDRRTVERQDWLDTQAGKLIRGQLIRAGLEPVETAAGSLSADRYDMQGGIDLILWYAGPHWVGLRFRPGDGSSIDYRRTSSI
jgi:hypothetical protein